MGIEDPDYQVGARFEALEEGVLAAASKLTGYFFAISHKVRWFGFKYIFAHVRIISNSVPKPTLEVFLNCIDINITQWVIFEIGTLFFFSFLGP